jgi:hypothetical protein
MPYIDENDKPVLLAYNETTGLVEPVKVDPIFGALQIYVVASTGLTYTDINNAKIDENENSTLLGYSETTGLPTALRCGANGELLILNV